MEIKIERAMIHRSGFRSRPFPGVKRLTLSATGPDGVEQSQSFTVVTDDLESILLQQIEAAGGVWDD